MILVAVAIERHFAERLDGGDSNGIGLTVQIGPFTTMWVLTKRTK